MNTYSVTLTNANKITIARACLLADKIQESIDKDATPLHGTCTTHVQGILMVRDGVCITIESPIPINDLFSVIMDNQQSLGYVDFKVNHIRK